MALISLLIPLISLSIFTLTLIVFPPAIGTNLTEAPAAHLGFVVYLFSPVFFIVGIILALFSRNKKDKFNPVAIIGLLLNTLLLIARLSMGSGIPI